MSIRSSHSPNPARWLVLSTIGLSLLAFVVICYSSTLKNSFLAEDFVTAWSVTAQTVVHMFFPGGGGYRPFMYVFWFLGNSFWGYNPFGFRVFIIGLHFINGCLIFTIARRLSRQFSVGLFAGLIFLSLATSADNVNWLSTGSNEVLCGLGYWFAILAYITLRQNNQLDQRKRRHYFVLAAASLLLALGSNEMALTWPFAAAIIGMYLHRAESTAALSSALVVNSQSNLLMSIRLFLEACLSALKTELRAMKPLLIIWLAFLVWRTIAVRGIGGYGPSVHLQAGLFLVNDAWTYISYFTLPLSHTPLGLQVMALIQSNYLLGISGLLVILFIFRRLWWFIALVAIMILPALNIPALYHGYLPGGGFAFMIALLVFDVLQIRHNNFFRNAVAMPVAILLVASQLLGVQERNDVWGTASTIARKILADTQLLIPSPADGTHFYFYGVPTNLGDSYVFTWGLREGIQATYGNRTLDAYRVLMEPDAESVKYDLAKSYKETGLESQLYPAVYLVYQANSPNSVQVVTRAQFKKIALTCPEGCLAK